MKQILAIESIYSGQNSAHQTSKQSYVWSFQNVVKIMYVSRFFTLGETAFSD